jgi:hypothetical protein
MVIEDVCRAGPSGFVDFMAVSKEWLKVPSPLQLGHKARQAETSETGIGCKKQEA